MAIETRPRRTGRGRTPRLSSAALLLLTAPFGLVVTATGSEAATLRLDDVVLTGLANPRGLTFGPDGWLYVAEAGRGGDGPSIVDGAGETVSYGATGAITRYRDGVQETVATDLPSLAPTGGFGATGAHDVAFARDGTLHAILGFGSDPSRRADLAGEAGSDLLGNIVSVRAGTVTSVADLAEFERLNGPDDEPNSNPFSLVSAPGGFVATDAGGNSVLDVSASGAISLRAYLPPLPNPLPFGPPVYQAVPTGATMGPDGDPLVGILTGFPFPIGGADVFDVDGAGTASVFASGFTNLIDVAYGDGLFYALELDSDSLMEPGTTGSLFSVAADGSRALLYGGLVNPTGLALGDRGRIYLSENGLSPTDGRIIELAPVPIPASLPLLAGALGAIGWVRRKRTVRG